jgi:G3E family GTPase
LTARLPASVITGFLGSGKTTLLSHLLRQPGGERIAVIVNEFGEVGVDHQLVEHVAEDIVLLNTGCLCCVLRNDLIETVERLLDRRAAATVPPFERIVVETSGLAEPGPVLLSFMSEVGIVSRLRLDGVITTVDTVNAQRQIAAHDEPAKQIALADRLLLTKTDLGTEAEVAGAHAVLRGLNPGAPIIEALNGEVASERLFGAGLYDPTTKIADVEGWLRADAHTVPHGAPHGASHGHDSGIRSFCLRFDGPVALAALTRWLSLITTLQGEDILRIKGIVEVMDDPRPLVVHGVHHLFHPPAYLLTWPPGPRGGRIVFITRHLSEDDVRASMTTMAA